MPNEKPFDTSRNATLGEPECESCNGLTGTVNAAQAVPSGSAPETVGERQQRVHRNITKT